MSSPQYWGANAPTQGAYKEHEVAEIFKPAAYASLLFMMADKRQVASGETLTVPAYEHLNFPTTVLLDEDQPIPLSKLNITAKTITMNERGRAVAITGKAARRSPFDILEAHKQAIQDMMSRELEEVCATALKTMPIKYVATGAATQTITTTGTTTASAATNVNIYHMQNIGLYLQDTLRVPYIRNTGYYAGLLRGSAVFSIRRDSEYRALNEGIGLKAVQRLGFQPGSAPDRDVDGIIGDIMVFKHNDSRVLLNNIGTSSLYSEALIFGDQGVCFGFIEQIGLRYDFSESKATDFGRFKYIAWMGDYGAGIYSDSANSDLARGLHVTSA